MRSIEGLPALLGWGGTVPMLAPPLAVTVPPPTRRTLPAPLRDAPEDAPVGRMFACSYVAPVRGPPPNAAPAEPPPRADSLPGPLGRLGRATP